MRKRKEKQGRCLGMLSIFIDNAHNSFPSDEQLNRIGLFVFQSHPMGSLSYMIVYKKELIEKVNCD